MIGKRAKRPETVEKILDVDASMQGSLVFNDPVNLKINGRFEGSLTTKGNLTIGENAEVNADIVGENIIVAGMVAGDIIAEKSLKLVPPARVVGNISTVILEIAEGAVLHGNCQMIFDEADLSRLEENRKKNVLSADEVARYLEVEPSSVVEWASSGRLKGRNENGKWWFDRIVIEDWVRSEKAK